MQTSWAGAFGFAAACMVIPTIFAIIAIDGWLIRRAEIQRLEAIAKMDPTVARIFLSSEDDA